MTNNKKIKRQEKLKKVLQDNLFYTDEDLAQLLDVSIQTIRIDRLGLGIPELRERTRLMAQEAKSKVTAIACQDIVGELIDLNLGQSAISRLHVSEDMVLKKTQIAHGHYIFAQANSLALAVIDASAAVTGVANIKYKIPVFVNDKIIAKAEVKKIRGNKYFVWVKTRNDKQEVFRAKFIMVSLEK